MALAAATPSGEPAITTWPGALKLATHTSRRRGGRRPRPGRRRGRARRPSCRGCRCRRRASRRRARTTRRTPSSKPSAPVAVSAVYSPRLWPAQKLGSMPRRSTASSTIRLETNVVSWALRVSFSSSASASSSRRATSRSATSRRLVDELPALVVGPGPTHARALRALAGEGERKHDRCSVNGYPRVPSLTVTTG